MARPLKEGMDYFPHDTDASNDEKIETLRALYGNDGYAFYFILLERIYRTPEMMLDCSDNLMIKLLAKKVGIRLEKFEKIIETAMKLGCFDGETWTNSKILTSNGIRRRAETILKKRANWRGARIQSSGLSNEITPQITQPVTPQETMSVTPQSKLNITKQKKSIYINIFEHWNSLNIISHKNITGVMEKAIDTALLDYSDTDLKTAMSNYAEIVHGEQYYFKHKWTISEFLSRQHGNNIERFQNIEVARSNFLNNGGRNDGQTGQTSKAFHQPARYTRPEDL